MLRIAYSGKSRPSALKIASELNNQVELIRDSTTPVDVNWGRANANSQLNPDISNVTNKRRMRELFKEHGVPMPRLVSRDEICTLAIRNERIGPFIGRPDKHTKGRGLWKICNVTQLNRALRGTRKKKAATHFMEYIDKERAPREYRVHIFKGKSIRISEKVYTDESKKEYTTGKPRHEIGHVRQAAKDAIAAVGLDFGAVDVLANDSECWVLEVNSAPGVGGSMPRVYAEAFRKWKEEQ